MPIEFSDIENAFFFVSMAPKCTNTAILCKETGEFHLVSGFGDSDELPEDVDDSDRYVEIPHKNELDLGVRLVRDFVSQRLPERPEEVEGIFSRRGAYSRFKALLASCGLLEDWHRYEQRRSEAALREWCSDQGIELAG